MERSGELAVLYRSEDEEGGGGEKESAMRRSALYMRNGPPRTRTGDGRGSKTSKDVHDAASLMAEA